MLKIFLAALIFAITTTSLAQPVIVDKPIKFTANRERLIQEYSLEHYGTAQTRIIPQAVVIHWTACDKFETAYNWFYNEAMSDGSLNVASQFIVDRDGTIYRLTEETALDRHIIGYNHCAIGIENVGGVNGVEDLTVEQLNANVELIRYLCEKYPEIKYVFGHYQQNAAKVSELYIELVPDYYAEKIDPGTKFMQDLKDALIDDDLIFFDE